MKKFVSLLEAIAFFFMAFPMTALAADGAAESISLVYCIPFAGLLLCVAVLPFDKSRMVGEPSASCGGVLVFAVCDSVCYLFWRGGSGGEGAGMYCG